MLLVLWLVLSEYELVKPIFLPPLLEVGQSLRAQVFTLEGVRDVIATLQRAAFGFMIAVAIAVPIGIILGTFKRFYESLELIIDFFRSVPTTAMFPLFLVFFGFGDLSKVAMAAWASGYVVLVNTIHGVWSAKQLRKIMAQTKQATGFQILRKITFFEALPFIFAGMRVGVSWNLIVIIVAEMFIGTRFGLGHQIYDASIVFDTAGVIAGIIVIGTVGYLVNQALVVLEKRLIHWKGV